jgi:hypothetical protein
VSSKSDEIRKQSPEAENIIQEHQTLFLQPEAAMILDGVGRIRLRTVVNAQKLSFAGV